jgi:hypothetical protein
MMAEMAETTPKHMEEADKKRLVLVMIITRCDDCAGEAFKLHSPPFFYISFPLPLLLTLCEIRFQSAYSQTIVYNNKAVKVIRCEKKGPHLFNNHLIQ